MVKWTLEGAQKPARTGRAVSAQVPGIAGRAEWVWLEEGLIVGREEVNRQGQKEPHSAPNSLFCLQMPGKNATLQLQLDR